MGTSVSEVGSRPAERRFNATRARARNGNIFITYFKCAGEHVAIASVQRFGTSGRTRSGASSRKGRSGGADAF
jgi:hypothetical protein